MLGLVHGLYLFGVGKGINSSPATSREVQTSCLQQAEFYTFTVTDGGVPTLTGCSDPCHRPVTKGRGRTKKPMSLSSCTARSFVNILGIL